MGVSDHIAVNEREARRDRRASRVHKSVVVVTTKKLNDPSKGERGNELVKPFSRPSTHPLWRNEIPAVMLDQGRNRLRTFLGFIASKIEHGSVSQVEFSMTAVELSRK